jgi:hypothetical protein
MVERSKSCHLPCPDPTASATVTLLLVGTCNTLADIDLDFGLTSSSVLLAVKRLEMSVTAAVAVLENLCLVILA